MSMMPVEPVDYDTLSESVRRFVTERLHELEKGLRPLVDGSFGEVIPGHLSGYLGVLRELGRLYQLSLPPRSLQDLIPSSKVEQMLAGMRERHAREVAEAERLTEMRVRAELASGQKLTIQAAQSTVMSRLKELESRAVMPSRPQGGEAS